VEIEAEVVMVEEKESQIGIVQNVVPRVVLVVSQTVLNVVQ